MAWSNQILFGFASIGIVNMIYFFYITKPHVTEKANVAHCTIDSYLDALTLFMENNGKMQFTDSLSSACLGKADKKINNLIRNSVAKTIRNCQFNNIKHIQRREASDIILTLFTSWNAETDKYHVHNNTIINWSTFMPNVNLVLFTNDSSLSKIALERGWTVFPVIKHAAGGAPVLKHMFKVAMENFNSTFYGYANSDNLFESSLTDTLSTIKTEFSNKDSIFISGRRTNVAFLTMKEAASYGNIRKAAETRGELFANNAEDFFITNKNFDWSRIPDLVIGRRAYDNWLVLYARSVGARTIDVSKTLLAVHQTTKGGNFEGHSRPDPHYNDNLIAKLHLSRNYEKGFTTCIQYETFMSLCEDIEIMNRIQLPNYC